MSFLSRFTRRDFLALAGPAAAAAALGRSGSAQRGGTITGILAVDPHTELATLPGNYSGLSYESAQLANPAFFSAENRQLIALFRELTPHGVLRLGGGTSEFTTFSEHAPTGPPPFEVFGPDTSKTVKKGTTTSALALRNLRAFLDATGWSCLYGLNLGQGTKENAAAEAEAACRILGPQLLALQIGNEPDAFSHFRPRGWGPEDYIREWLEFHAAIVARAPQAKFAGPDISNKLSYLTAFAAMAPEHRDIVLLTLHYYAMGPAGNPLATMDNLLGPNPRLTTMKWSKISIVQQAMRTAHLPARISEINSCWNGGLEGVSNTFASALWCADMMLHFASLGISGVNLHGGGYGWYSPIVGSPSAGFTRRPEYFGIQFGQQFAGATLLRTDFECSSDRVTAYAARLRAAGKAHYRIALINKTTAPAEIRLSDSIVPKKHWDAVLLNAPSLDATTGVNLRRRDIRPAAHGTLRMDAHSAVLLTFEAPQS
ncbi:MAG: hypothetical protein ACRD3N_18750 [Terracidiphilus sp.]